MQLVRHIEHLKELPDGPYLAENYLGDITTIGLDVGITGGGGGPGGFGDAI
jgi:hypothetical protein